ncbi:unnamed protein product [Symbiodinium microadriaticum]|nr:unnamed protein product [Symbiodinium microadriaticum]
MQKKLAHSQMGCARQAMEFLQSLLGAFIALLELSMRGQERIVQRVVAHLADVRNCLRACVKRTEDVAIQRLLTVLAEMMDEKTDYDMQKVLAHLDPREKETCSKIQWPPANLNAALWQRTRIPHVGGA